MQYLIRTSGPAVTLILPDPSANLLPIDGEAYYFGPILGIQEASDFETQLRETIAWRRDEVVLYGKRIVTAREVAWYGDESFPYRYSGVIKVALPWNSALRSLKALVEERSQAQFNSCLLNLYHSGSEGMGWHSDDEKELTPQAAIASVSLGVERKFSFRHKQTKQTVHVLLEHGSLLLMKGATQTHWLHQLPPSRRVQAARINLTFRLMRPLSP